VRDEKIVHLEKVSSETVSGTKYAVWDVHTDRGRWWVLPTHKPLQPSGFPSLETR